MSLLPDSGSTPDSTALPMDRHAVVTRDEDPDEGRLGEALRELGVPVLHWATTAIAPPGDPSALGALPSTLSSYDWVVFTSRRGVEAVAEIAGPAPEGLRVAVVGAKTAEAARGAGWPAELVGDEGGEELARALAGKLRGGGRRILLPTTPLAADTLPELLEAAGHRVDRVEAYRTVFRALDVDACRDRIRGGGVGVVTFTSPSAVEGLERALPAELLRELRGRARAASIGPTTTEAAEARGWRCAESAERSLEGVARTARELLEPAGPGSTNESKGESDT